MNYSNNNIINRYEKEKYSSIIEHLPKKFYLVNNIGNWGDALIKKGTLEFFDDMGYEYEFLDIGRRKIDVLKKIDAQIYKNSTVVFVGGGCFCKNWFYLNREYFDELQKKFKEIIFLPNTYQNYEENYFLKTLDSKKFIFFRRDNFDSKEVLPNSIFAPDLALYIKHVSCDTNEKYKKGFIFRKDQESMNMHLGYINEDISSKGNEDSNIKYFFGYINQFKIIHTDRLHVAIAGYMLNKKVYLYSGNYNKNKDLYNTCFKEEEKIKFVEYGSFIYYVHKFQNFLILLKKFNSKQYLKSNPDLNKNWKFFPLPFIHLMLFGIREKRKIKYVKKYKEGISIITACMDRNENLEKALNSWLLIPDVKQIIVVDWSSKKSVYESLRKFDDGRVKFIQVEGEKHWKLTLAFNLAFEHVEFNKLAKLDADIILHKDFFNVHKLKNNSFFRGFARFARNENEKFLNGVLYCYSKDFYNINGYNEYLKNRYGYDDDDLYQRLVGEGLIDLAINNDFISHILHQVNLRVQNVYAKESLMGQWRINKKIAQKYWWGNGNKKTCFSNNFIETNFISVKRIKKLSFVELSIYFFELYYKTFKKYFDFESYLEINSDLVKKWNTPLKAFLHYVFFGKRGGREIDIQKKYSKPFVGEFGFEIANVIPKIFYLYKKGFLNKTYGLRGTKPFYFFSKNHIEVDGVRSDSSEGLRMQYSWKNEHFWRSPNYKEFFKNDIFVFKKPICVIYNKYTMEWEGNPINFISIDKLRQIISMLSLKYQIIYIRPRGTFDEIGYTKDRQDIFELNDYEMLNVEFPDVITFDMLIKKHPEMSFNELQVKVLANADHFISVQGGGSRLCSFFGGVNIIYHKEGKELGTGQYEEFFPKFSSAQILVCQTEDELINLVQNNFLKNEKNI